MEGEAPPEPHAFRMEGEAPAEPSVSEWTACLRRAVYSPFPRQKTSYKEPGRLFHSSEHLRAVGEPFRYVA